LKNYIPPHIIIYSIIYIIRYKGEMQMLPNLRSHKGYIEFVQKNLMDKSISKAHENVFDKLKLIDLTPIRLITLNLYSPKSGRPAFAHEDITYISL